MQINNEVVINKLVNFCYNKKSENLTDDCLRLFVESVVFGSSVKSYTIGQLDKAITNYLEKNNIDFKEE